MSKLNEALDRGLKEAKKSLTYINGIYESPFDRIVSVLEAMKEQEKSESKDV